MRAHVIENGLIVNTIEASSLDFPGLHLVDASLGGKIGDVYDPEALIPAAPPAVPDVVPMLNAHLTLIDAGLYESIDAYFNGLIGAQGLKDRAFWQKALTMRRDDPRVESIRSMLGLTTEQVDALFIDAAGRG